MPHYENDQSLHKLFQLMLSKSTQQALELVPSIQRLNVNFALSDGQQIAWQSAGFYPMRGNGRGLVPSLGWQADQHWQGTLEPSLLPYDIEPQSGFFALANQRLSDSGFGVQIGNQWVGEYRAKRLQKQLQHNAQNISTTVRLMNDPITESVHDVQAALRLPHIEQSLQQAIKQFPAAQQTAANSILHSVKGFNGLMQPTSKDAAIYAQFLQSTYDYLTASFSNNALSQQALNDHHQRAYPLALDHLLGRDQSPLWSSNQANTKPNALAQILLNTHSALEQQLGQEQNWQWQHLVKTTHSLPFKLQPSTAKSHLGIKQGSNETLRYLGFTNDSFAINKTSQQRLLIDFALSDPLLALTAKTNIAPYQTATQQAWKNNAYNRISFKPQTQQRDYPTAPLMLVPAATN